MILRLAGADGVRGAFSGSCKLEKRSLSKKLQRKLDKGRLCRDTSAKRTDQ